MTKDAKEMEEYVLVFPTELLNRLGDFQGLSSDVQKYLDVILNPKNHQYMKRKEAETNFQHKQLIPYVILHHENKIFSYRRGKLLAEKRLMGNRSIGIGGHISVNDPNLFGTTYQEGLKREVNEEIIIESPYKEKVAGLINDNSNEVGKVHFGIIHVFSLEKPKIRPREKSINETGFSLPGDLQNETNDFENWSKICLEGLDQLIR